MCIEKNLIPQGNEIEEIKTRKALIIDFYRQWRAAHPSQKMYNNNLKDYINIRQISINETAYHASKTYLSTLAVLQLDAILACARKVRIGKPKARSNQSRFQAVIQMEHECPGVGLVRLMVGVRFRSHLKIQYCITAVNVEE